MINLIIRLFRKLVNREFYTDSFVRVDSCYVKNIDYSNGPINW